MNFRSTRHTHAPSVICCVVYDAADGMIRHVHRVVTMPGARPTSEPEMEARTLALADKLGLDISRLRVLHVHSERLTPGYEHTVDVKTRELLSRPLNRQPVGRR